MKLRNTSMMFTIALLALGSFAMADNCATQSGPPVAVVTANSVTQTLCYPQNGQDGLSFTAPLGVGQSTTGLFTFATFDPTLLSAGQVLLGIKITFTVDFTATGSVDYNTTNGQANFIIDLEDHGKLCQSDTDPNKCFAPGFGVPGQIDDQATLIGLKLDEMSLSGPGSVSDSLANPATGPAGSEVGGGPGAVHLSTVITVTGTGTQGLGGNAFNYVGTGNPGTYGSDASNIQNPGNNAVYNVANGQVVLPVNMVGFSSTLGGVQNCQNAETQNPGLNAFGCSNTQSLSSTYTGTADAIITVEYDFGSPVPEPGSLMLLGSGLTGLAAFIRRKVAKS